MNWDESSSDLVHQIFIGLGGRGMHALASSFPRDELHERWEQILVPYVRLQSFDQRDPPRVTFSYLTFDDGNSAILRRVDEGDSPGRNNGHALVGSAAVLGPRALSLTATVRWATTPEDMGRELYPIDQWDDVIPLPAGVDVAKEYTEPASRLIAHVLADPRAKISVIGVEHDLALPALTLFENVLKPVFATEPPIRSWSFSTYEVRDADLGPGTPLPEVIFLPGVPGGAGETHHERIFPGESSGVEDEYHQLANSLITEYRDLGRRDYSGKIEDELRSHEIIDSRIQHLLADRCHFPLGGHRISEASNESSEVARNARVHPDSSPFIPAAQGATVPPESPVFSSGHYVARPGRTDAASTAPKPPVAPPQADDHEELVRKLETDIPVRRNVREIVEKLSESGVAPDRDRWRLISTPAVLNAISAALDPWERIAGYAKMLRYAFGPDLTVLHQEQYFYWVCECIERSDTDLYFGCAIFALVEGSPMESRCNILLRRRWPETSGILAVAPRRPSLPREYSRLLIVVVVVLLLGFFVIALFSGVL